MISRARSSGLGLWPAILLSVVSMLAGCGGGDSDDDPIPAQPSPTIQRIEVTPAAPSIAKGTTQAFVATAVLSDSTTQTVTEAAAWTSANAAVATVSNTAGSKGLVTGSNTGSTTITVNFEGQSASATLTVTPATVSSIQVTPTNPSIAKGTAQPFTATAIFSDASNQNVTASATWLSSNTGVATVSNAAGTKGLAFGQNVGSASISASFGGSSGSTTLTVTPAVLTAVQVTPTNPSIAKGTTQQFTATAIFSDATNQNVTETATWASSSAAVATVSNTAGSRGLASAVSVGSANIFATFGGSSGSTVLTVTPAVIMRVDVSPTNPSVPKGGSQQFVATAVFSDGTNQAVTSDAGTVWSSSNTGVAQVSNAAASKGFAVALGEGTASISASFSGSGGSTTMTVTPASITAIQVTPENESLPVAFTQQYVAMGTLSDGSTRDVTSEVTWISTSPDKATIDNAAGSRGLATGVAAGGTTITALAGAIQDSTQLTVRGSVLTSIEVTPNNLQLPLGRSQSYTATGVFDDATTENLTTQVTWSSSDAAVATVSNAAGSKGLVQSVTQGITTITATHAGTTVSGNEPLEVVAAALESIVITPDPASIPKGRTQQFTAMGTFSNSSVSDITADVTWSPSAPAVATIANGPNDGLATAVSVGTTTITATLGTVSDTATLNVTAAVLDKIEITPPTASIAKGREQAFMATGTFSDNSTMNLTASATWSSSAPAIASISNAAGSQGQATGLAVGASNITASSGAITSDPAALEVTPAVLDSIAITPANPSVPKGLSRQLAATGTFSDASTQDLTADVTWSSANNTIASVSNDPASKGLLSANNTGTAAIKAVDPATLKEGTTTATVTAAIVTGVGVTPLNATLPNGFSLQYKATAQLSDSGSQDVTASATWSSANSAVANISNVAASKGRATAMAPGVTSITALFGGFSGSTGLTVSGETLSSIDVTPKNVTNFASGATLQYSAMGTFSGGAVLNITTQVTWASSNGGAASISNAAGSQGRATAGAVPAASTTISATAAGKTGSTTLTRGVP